MTIIRNASQSTEIKEGVLKTKPGGRIKMVDHFGIVKCPDQPKRKDDTPTQIEKESKALLKADTAADDRSIPVKENEKDDSDSILVKPHQEDAALAGPADGEPSADEPSEAEQKRMEIVATTGVEPPETKAEHEAAVDEILAATEEPPEPPKPPEKKKVKDESYIVNIADIPISFRLFQSWWSEKVINRGFATMPLKQFISDSINSLIVSALEAEATSMVLPTQKKDLITVPFSADAPSDPAEADAFRFLSTGDIATVIKRDPFDKKGAGSGLLFLEDLTTGESPFLPLPTNRDQKISNDNLKQSYFFIFCRENNPTRTYRLNNIGDYRRDLRDGIYHLHSGKDAGLVKDIKMSVVTFAPFETHKILESLDAQKSGPVYRKRIYNAEVTLFGAPFLRPTQIVYINPAAHGAPQVLRDMGLSGYYMIQSVRNHFEGGKFQTTLTCAFQYDGSPPTIEGDC
jgi:hypothetical protein